MTNGRTQGNATTAELEAALHWHEADRFEVIAAIGGYFESSSTTGRKTRYPGSGETKIEITRDRSGRLRLAAGPALSSDDLQDLSVRIAAGILADHGDRPAVVVAFSNWPVRGVFGVPGEFSIRPVPGHAPRSSWAPMGPHPFLLEVSIRDSSLREIRGHRREAAAGETLRLLNALLQPIWASNIVRGVFALDRPSGEYRHTQEGYWFDGHNLFPDDFCELHEPRLPRVPDDLYYSWRGGNEDTEFELPVSFEADLERVRRIGVDARARLLRNGHWRMMAGDLRFHHAGSWYIALVSAIETLVWENMPQDPCPTCLSDRNQHWPTRRFKDFVSRYAPGSGARDELDAMYRLRSDLVHGRSVLTSWFPISPVAAEWEQVRRLHSIVGAATINWLRDQPMAKGSGSLRACDPE